jgi:hypothetical protein
MLPSRKPSKLLNGKTLMELATFAKSPSRIDYVIFVSGRPTALGQNPLSAVKNQWKTLTASKRLDMAIKRPLNTHRKSWLICQTIITGLVGVAIYRPKLLSNSFCIMKLQTL